jgi:2-methylcitrate dehydratase PrpD
MRTEYLTAAFRFLGSIPQAHIPSKHSISTWRPEALAEWASGLRYSYIPANVADAAVTILHNRAGCANRGLQPVRPYDSLTVTRPFSGPETSSIYGANNSALFDAQTDILSNGIASHVDGYDDTRLETIIHLTGHVASVLGGISQAPTGSVGAAVAVG